MSNSILCEGMDSSFKKSKLACSTWLAYVVLLSVLVIHPACKTFNHLKDIDQERISLDETVVNTEDEDIVDLIRPYKAQLDAEMDVVIGETKTELRKDSGILGNWMADAMHAQVVASTEHHVDFTVTNRGGIRVPSIAAGAITVRDIYQLMPFDNEIVILELSGKTLNQMMDHIVKDGGWPINSTINMSVSANKQIDAIHIQGERMDADKTYRMAITDYVANGGSGCDFLKEVPQIETGLRVRDAIIDYLKAHDEVFDVQLDDRYTIKNGQN